MIRVFENAIALAIDLPCEGALITSYSSKNWDDEPVAPSFEYVIHKGWGVFEETKRTLPDKYIGYDWLVEPTVDEYKVYGTLIKEDESGR